MKTDSIDLKKVFFCLLVIDINWFHINVGGVYFLPSVVFSFFIGLFFLKNSSRASKICYIIFFFFNLLGGLTLFYSINIFLTFQLFAYGLILGFNFFSIDLFNTLTKKEFNCFLILHISLTISLYLAGLYYLPEKGEYSFGYLNTYYIGRLSGTQSSPNMFAMLNLLFIIHSIKNNSKGSLIILLIMLQILTLSGTGIIAMIIILAFNLNRLKAIVSIVITGLLIIGVAFLSMETRNLFELAWNAKLNKSSTMTGRTEFWKEGLQKIFEKPVFGHGLNTSRDFLHSFGFHDTNSLHNTILEILYSNGLIGLIGINIFLLYWLFLFGTNKYKYFTLICFGCFFMANNVLYTQPFLFGLTTFLSQSQKNKI